MSHEKKHKKIHLPGLLHKPWFHLLLTLFFIVVSFLLVRFLQQSQDVRQRAAGQSITFVNPSDGEKFPANTPILLAVRASTSTGQITKVEFFYRNSKGADILIGNGSYSTKNGNYEFNWTSPISGTYPLVATLWVDSKYVGNSGYVTITVESVDVDGPTVSITSPESNASVRNPIFLQATASDPSGVSKVEFFLNNGNNTLIYSDTQAPYEGYSTVSLPVGNNQSIYARATDNLGNTRSSSSRTFNVLQPDTNAPTVQITNPTGGSVTSPVNFTATATDNIGGTGISYVEFYIDGALAAKVDTSPYQYSNVRLSAGSHSVYAKAYDRVTPNPNVGTSTTINFTVSSDTTFSINIGRTPTGTITLGGATTAVALTTQVTSGTLPSGAIIEYTWKLGSASEVSIGTSSDSSHNFPVAWSLANRTAGTYTVTAYVHRSDFSDTGVSDTESVILQSSGGPGSPSVTVAATGTLRVGGPVTLTATTQNVTGITDVRFFEGTTDLCPNDANRADLVCSNWTPTEAKTYQVVAQVTATSLTTPLRSAQTPVIIQQISNPGNLTITIQTPVENENVAVSGVMNILARVTNPVSDMIVKFSIKSLDTEVTTSINSNVPLKANTTGDYEHNWTASVPAGAYIIYTKVYVNGQEKTSDDVHVTVGPPTIINKTPISGHVANQAIHLRSIVSNPQGTPRVEFWEGSTKLCGPGALDSNGEYVCDWPAASVTAGSHTIQARLYINSAQSPADTDDFTITVNAVTTVRIRAYNESYTEKTEFHVGERFLIRTTVSHPTSANVTVSCIQMYYRKEGREAENEYLTMGAPGKTCTSTSATVSNVKTYTFNFVGVQVLGEGTFKFKAIVYSESTLQNNVGESEPLAITVKAAPVPTEAPQPTSAPVPTTQPIPTNTIAPGNTAFNFNLLLHGIGKAGDNVTPGRGGNMSPVHPQRTVKFEIYDGSNQKVSDKEGTVQFNSTDGNFTGKIDAGTLTPGSYSLRVWSSQYLWRRVQGIQIAGGNNETAVQASLVTGDTNNDNKINILDYNMLLDCYADLAEPKNCSDQSKKQITDLTDDGKVNLFDLNLFLRELSNQDGD